LLDDVRAMSQMLHRSADVGANRRTCQSGKIVSEVCRQEAFDRRSNQINDGVQIARLIFDRPLQLLQRRLNGAALRVAQYHDQACAKLLGGELDAADEGRGDDVAGDTDDEQVSQSL